MTALTTRERTAPQHLQRAGESVLFWTAAAILCWVLGISDAGLVAMVVAAGYWIIRAFLDHRSRKRSMAVRAHYLRELRAAPNESAVTALATAAPEWLLAGTVAGIDPEAKEELRPCFLLLEAALDSGDVDQDLYLSTRRLLRELGVNRLRTVRTLLLYRKSCDRGGRFRLDIQLTPSSLWQRMKTARVATSPGSDLALFCLNPLPRVVLSKELVQSPKERASDRLEVDEIARRRGEGRPAASIFDRKLPKVLLGYRKLSDDQLVSDWTTPTTAGFWGTETQDLAPEARGHSPKHRARAP